VTRPVLFLNPVATLGGAERFLLDLLAEIRQARPGWPLHLIVGGDGPLCEMTERLGVTVEIVPLPEAAATFGESGLRWAGGGRLGRWAGTGRRALAAAIGMPRYLRALRRRVVAAQPRLIHSNGLKCHLLAGFVAPRSVPVVWHIHDFLTTRPILGRAFSVLPRPTVAIANSETVAADTRKALPGVRTEAIHNGIDLERFAPGPADGAALDRLGGFEPAPPETVRVGLVSTYARWKGQDVFLEAIARIAANGPPARFFVVGGPMYRTAGSQFTEAELRERIAALGLKDRVGLVPFQRESAPVYRALDVVVHASTRPEPFGLTIVEAMACGRAVIVAKAGGATELFTDGIDALGVEPGNVTALAATIEALLGDRNRRDTLGRAARASAAARFSRTRMAEQVLQVYDRVCGPV
jgi:glycosyltransferase involved in cell wall biosynthesis